ncbi:MAG: hypothetical protein ACRD16_01760 [Thermoanaerobaculia bacterium]
MKRNFWRGAALAAAIMGLSAARLARAGAAGLCESDPAFHRLDFWVGDWDVYDSGTSVKAGSSALKKILKGCAISVDWLEADGKGEIQELFFYEKARDLWHQVWISDAGPTKERRATAGGPAGSLRFLGDVLMLDGRSYLDRSTVTPMPAGGVHQLIEISRDGGSTWQATFDAVYRRRVSRSVSGEPGPGRSGR